MVGKFRMEKETLAVLSATRLAVIVPKDAIIEILVAPPADHRTVDVLWNGETAMMFVDDLKTRSKSASEIH